MLDVHGSFSLPITTVTANYTAGANDYTILCNNAASSPITITLPTAAGISGRVYIIKKIAANSSNAVTLDGYGSETIDGATTVAIATQYSSYTIQSNGTSWFVIAVK
jgi:hypothetical protein